MKSTTVQLFDPRRGDLALTLEQISSAETLSRPQRHNSFTVLLLREGKGRFNSDLSDYAFQAPALIFFNPYQTYFLAPDSAVEGMCLRFHANFFCIETHHNEVGCNGVLFNDSYGHPLVQLNEQQMAEFAELASRIEVEMAGAGLAHTEILVSYLKVFLIKATRLKIEQQPLASTTPAPAGVPATDRLIQLIEQHYRSQHSPAFYASALHLTPKALGKRVKARFKRTLTELIRERLLKQAKWQLLHTLRPVKEIAWEIGFSDELYFSRLFRRSAGLSPTAFREFETAIRGGSNLSM